MYYFESNRIDGTDSLPRSYELRYQVYCQERGYLNPGEYPDRQEIDAFDAQASHFGAFNWEQVMVGTVRLVYPSALGFPMDRHCSIDPAGSAQLESPLVRVAEVSRLSVSRYYRRRATDGQYGLEELTPEPDLPSWMQESPDRRRCHSPIVIVLYKHLYLESRINGLTHLLFAMEKSLCSILRRYGFPFRPLGPEVDYFGPVTPYLMDLTELEDNLARSRPALWAQLEQTLTEARAENLDRIASVR